MRAVQTIILRLFLDSETPGKMRGTLRAVLDFEEHTFVNEQGLVTLLRQAASGALVEIDPLAQSVKGKQAHRKEYTE